MKLTKIDLTNLLAISHDDDQLGLIIDRGNSLEIIEIPAPLAAYEGLQQLNAIVETPALAAIVDFNALPGVEPAIPMQPVQSTMAVAIGYDAEQNVLQVQFKNGSTYQYEGVDEHIWEDLQTTDSPGRLFNQEIKGYYRSRRLC